MDRSVALMFIVLAAVVAGSAIWAVMRGRIPPGFAKELAAAAAAIRAQMSVAMTEERVKALAGALYDSLGYGSKYVSREIFCGMVWDLVKQSLDLERNVAMAVGTEVWLASSGGG